MDENFRNKQKYGNLLIIIFYCIIYYFIQSYQVVHCEIKVSFFSATFLWNPETMIRL